MLDCLVRCPVGSACWQLLSAGYSSYLLSRNKGVEITTIIHYQHSDREDEEYDLGKLVYIEVGCKKVPANLLSYINWPDGQNLKAFHLHRFTRDDRKSMITMIKFGNVIKTRKVIYVQEIWWQPTAKQHVKLRVKCCENKSLVFSHVVISAQCKWFG